jgi:hypothetical protein
MDTEPNTELARARLALAEAARLNAELAEALQAVLDLFDPRQDPGISHTHALKLANTALAKVKQ